MKIGFLINPIAGMGGRVGLKGTDHVVDDALALGATPVAGSRAALALGALHVALQSEPAIEPVDWLTCEGDMGVQALIDAGFKPQHCVDCGDPADTGASRTSRAVRAMVAEGAQLIVFCGGDGTAADISRVVGMSTPVLGIPAGVKMFSGVFATSPERAAAVLLRYLKDEISCATVDVMDLDEARYRQGELVVALRASVRTPAEPSYVQSAKALIHVEDDAQVKAQMAEFLSERMAEAPGRLYLFGPGSTVRDLAAEVGVTKALLSIDAVVNGEVVGTDLNEDGLLELLDTYQPGAIILSPIGAQGFVLGRGNQPFSPAVVRQFGADRIWVFATPAKVKNTPVLRVDTGDSALDQLLAERRYWPVITGYRRRRAVPIIV